MKHHINSYFNGVINGIFIEDEHQYQFILNKIFKMLREKEITVEESNSPALVLDIFWEYTKEGR